MLEFKAAKSLLARQYSHRPHQPTTPIAPIAPIANTQTASLHASQRTRKASTSATPPRVSRNKCLQSRDTADACASGQSPKCPLLETAAGACFRFHTAFVGTNPVPTGPSENPTAPLPVHFPDERPAFRRLDAEAEKVSGRREIGARVVLRK